MLKLDVLKRIYPNQANLLGQAVKTVGGSTETLKDFDITTFFELKKKQLDVRELHDFLQAFPRGERSGKVLEVFYKLSSEELDELESNFNPNDKKYDQAKKELQKKRNLVFESGGPKCLSYIGSLIILDKLDALKNIKRVAGVSAGALTAMMIALGYPVEDIKKQALELDLKSVAEINLRDLFKLKAGWKNILQSIVQTFTLKKMGYTDGDNLSKLLSALIKKQLGDSEASFADLHKKTSKDSSFKDLYVKALNVTSKKEEIFSFETTPNVKIKDALRASMGYPIIFKPIEIKPGQQLIDGGLLNSFPIDIFDSDKYCDDSSMMISDEERPMNLETLGFRIEDFEENRRNINDPEPVSSLYGLLHRLIGILRVNSAKHHLRDKDWDRSIASNTETVSETDFGVSDEAKRQLMKNGIFSTFAFLDKLAGLKTQAT